MMKETHMQYAGPHFLPDLTPADVEAIEKKEFHKVKNTMHVQAMAALINDTHALPPTEAIGAVLAYDEHVGSAHHQGFVLISGRDDDSGEFQFKMVPYLDTIPTYDVIDRLSALSNDEVIIERFDHVPDRVK